MNWKFMNGNVNSFAKDNFQRVRLMEAHTAIFNYDLISICETSLVTLLRYLKLCLMFIRLCRLTIQIIVDMVGLVYSSRTLFQL